MKMHIAASALLFICLPAIHAQDVADGKPQEQDTPEIAAKKAVEADLATRKKNFMTQSEDLESISKSLPSTEARSASAIVGHAQNGALYLDATYWFVGIYDRAQCDDDKNLAKAVLQNRLGFYAHMLDMDVDQTNGWLGLSRIPAVAQQGQRIRDELRAAKLKLDEIAASLK